MKNYRIIGICVVAVFCGLLGLAQGAETLLEDDFSSDLAKWYIAGSPSPSTVNTEGNPAPSFCTNDDLNYCGFAVSKQTFQYTDGLTVSVDTKPGNAAFPDQRFSWISFNQGNSLSVSGSSIKRDPPMIRVMLTADNYGTTPGFGEATPGPWISFYIYDESGEEIEAEKEVSIPSGSGWHNISFKILSDLRVEFFLDDTFMHTSSNSISSNFDGNAGLTIGARLSYYDNVSVLAGAGGPVDINEGLVAYYPFNGNANDESGNGNDGVVNGATLTEDGKAYSFDGSGLDNIQLPIITPLDGSVAFWVFFDTLSTSQSPAPNYVFNGGSSNWNIFKIGVHPDKVPYFDLYDSPTKSAKDVTFTIDAGNWYFFTAIWGTTGMKFYVNGELIGTNSYTGNGAGDQPLYIGNQTIQADVFDGTIDDVRIYNRALTATEISELYQSTFIEAPSAATSTATSVSASIATLNGMVNPNGALTTVIFEYGTSTGYGNTVTANQSPISGLSAQSVSVNISGLTPATTYHFRVKAINSAGTAYGSDMSFTASLPPTTTTNTATLVSFNSATLNGTVNPNGASTTVTFEYGTTTTYGNTFTAIESPISGSSAQSVSASLSSLTSDLTSDTTYHFRVKATNSAGASYGKDLLFTTLVSKSMIITGGPTTGNNIWDAVKAISEYAFKSLNDQGYSKSDIYFLSPDMDQDADGDGKPDVDASADNTNIETAIKDWAKDAGQLLLYMIGHGGEGKFKLDTGSYVYSSDLKGWLDDFQADISKQVIIVYDACYSGSFLNNFAPPVGSDRILATSSRADETSVIMAGGTLSFSYLFWSNMLGGNTFYNSFCKAKDSVGISFRDPDTLEPKMHPQLDANGDGVANEKEDKTLASLVQIGSFLPMADIPTIEDITPPHDVYVGTSTAIWVTGVDATEGVQRVWAVITPPNYSSEEDNPVTDLPVQELYNKGDEWEGSYAGFSTVGKYSIAVFAEDTKGFLSEPKPTVINAVSSYTPLPPCPDCGGDRVTIDSEFGPDTRYECTASESITLKDGTEIKQGANMVFRIE